MSELDPMFAGLEATSGAPPQAAAQAPAPRARIKPVDRSQLMMRPVDVERLVEEDHPARAIWEFVGQLDLSGYEQPIEAVEGVAGRPVWDPRLLISLWIYAYSRGMGSAREIHRRLDYDPAFQWLAGLEVINNHTLSDFRVAYDHPMTELFVNSLGVMSAEGLVSLERVMHDGTKIRACAGADSFRRVRPCGTAAKSNVPGWCSTSIGPNRSFARLVGSRPSVARSMPVKEGRLSGRRKRRR